MTMHFISRTPDPYVRYLRYAEIKIKTLTSDKDLKIIEIKLLTRAIEMGEIADEKYSYGCYNTRENAKNLLK